MTLNVGLVNNLSKAIPNNKPVIAPQNTTSGDKLDKTYERLIGSLRDTPPSGGPKVTAQFWDSKKSNNSTISTA